MYYNNKQAGKSMRNNETDIKKTIPFPHIHTRQVIYICKKNNELNFVVTI